MSLSRLAALNLLAECTGDDIWSIEYCQQRNIPQQWIDGLVDCYESGFAHDNQTIYYQNQITNQFEGIRDVDLAVHLAAHLGVHTVDLVESAFSRAQLVQSIIERAEEE